MSSGGFCSRSLVSTEEDFLIRKILMTHNPDGCQLDSQLLLRAVKNIIHCPSPPASGANFDPETLAINIWDVEAIGLQDTLGYSIFMVSHEILSRCFEEGNLHSKTMLLFDTSQNFKWDAKVALVVAAFFILYGKFQLIVQLQSHHTLPLLVSLLRQFPYDLKGFRAQFKPLLSLIETMIELTQVIIDFENLPLQQELLEFEVLSLVKSKIYVASYWIFRSTLASFSLITGLRTTKHDQVNSNSKTIASYTIFNLVHRLSGLCFELRKQLEKCRQQMGTELYKKLLNLFKQIHVDNQETLQMLIPFVDNFPLKDCLSGEKHDISELKHKVVILLVSPAELLPIEKIFLLVQRTYDHPQQAKLGGNYMILWIPLPSSHTWNQGEEISFHFLSNSLPFWSLRQPWFLNSAVVSFIKQEWSYKGETMLIVLDANGVVTNSNAMDMIWIWGVDAFPFSNLREQKLWEMEKWNLQLVTNGVDPLLTKWVEEDKDICIYGSDNLDWIKEFTAKIKEMRKTGLQLEVIYVGRRNASDRLQTILDVIKQESLSACLTSTKVCFFWLRLESMKDSITRQEHTAGSDAILDEVLGLMDVDNNNNSWMLMGKGSLPGIVKLRGMEAIECFNLFPGWAEKVENLGFVGAVQSSFEPPVSLSPCNHSEVLPYKEGLMQGIVFCPVCKRTMEKFLLYKCEGTDQ